VIFGNGIGDDGRCFAYLPNLVAITFGSETAGLSGLYNVSYSRKLTTINVDPNNANYSSIDGVLFNKDQTILLKYPAGRITREYKIPASVTSIEDGAFEGCNGLKSISVDTNNTNYSSIDGVLFNKDQTILIQYPAGKAVSRYILPDGVTSIERWAFGNCKNLKSIVVKNMTPPECDNPGIVAACTLYVPQGSAYDTTNGWNEFKHIGYMDSTGKVLQVVSAVGKSFAEDQYARKKAAEEAAEVREAARKKVARAQENINYYTKQFVGCEERQSLGGVNFQKCYSVIKDLGYAYYNYERAMLASADTAEHVKPDYSKSIQLFQRLLDEYGFMRDDSVKKTLLEIEAKQKEGQ